MLLPTFSLCSSLSTTSASASDPGSRLAAPLLLRWTEYQAEDAMALSAALCLLSLCTASGQCDETLLFGMICTLFGALVTWRLPELEVETILRELSGPGLQTDVVGWAEAALGVEIGRSAGAVLFSVGWVAAGAGVVVLARHTLQKYSPAACVVLYCACLSTVLRDRAAESPWVLGTIVASMCLLSLKSNHVLRLHIAAACFCACMLLMSEWVQRDPQETGIEIDLVLGPSGVSLCLTVGLGACLVHDLTANFLLEPAVDFAHLCYVLLSTLFSVDSLLELVSKNIVAQERLSWLTPKTQVASLRWEDCLMRLGRVRLAAGWHEVLKYENLVAIAPLFCVSFALTMTVRRLLSPTSAWRRDRPKIAIGLVLMAVAMLLVWVYVNEYSHIVKVVASPAALTMGSGLVYLLVSLVTESTKYQSIAKGKWWTMVYFRTDDGSSKTNTSLTIGGAEHMNRSEPPPFFIRGADDTRVKHIVEELRDLESTYKNLTLQVYKLERANERPEQRSSPDLSLMDQLARQQIQAASVACRAAVASEKIALQLRELASDAETERDLLVSIRKDAKAHAAAGIAPGKQARDQHYMVIKRQMDNAMKSFKFLREEMEEAETKAETLMEKARRELRRAVKYYASCRLTTRDKQMRTDLDKLMTTLTTQIDKRIMDPVQMNHQLVEAKNLFRDETLRAGRSLPSGASSDAGLDDGNLNSGTGFGANGGTQPTPYELAMQRKGISSRANITDEVRADETTAATAFNEAGCMGFQTIQGEGEPELTTSTKFAQYAQLNNEASSNPRMASSSEISKSSSQRSRRRRWWPFSSSSSRSKRSSSGPIDGSNGTSSDGSQHGEKTHKSKSFRRSLNLSNKRK